MFQYGYSPLRYPGGKFLLSNFLTDLIKINNLQGGTYYELYAGGAGAALKLLCDNVVDKIVINDADFRIYAFWHSVLFSTSQFLREIDQSSINIKEWEKQKSIYENALNEDIFQVGFATFFLNRTNRSGILHKAGPIGGRKQDGLYSMDVRFNKEDLKKRINHIASRSDSIELFNCTTESFIENIKLQSNSKAFFYLDPPYYNKGKELYLNNYTHDQHEHLSNLLRESGLKYWLVSYDNEIAIKNMYNDFRKASFNFNYSLQDKKNATELLIFSDKLKVPKFLIIRKNKLELDAC